MVPRRASSTLESLATVAALRIHFLILSIKGLFVNIFHENSKKKKVANYRKQEEARSELGVGGRTEMCQHNSQVKRFFIYFS
jgi:hypothetical protein